MAMEYAEKEVIWRSILGNHDHSGFFDVDIRVVLRNFSNETNGL